MNSFENKNLVFKIYSCIFLFNIFFYAYVLITDGIISNRSISIMIIHFWIIFYRLTNEIIEINENLNKLIESEV